MQILSLWGIITSGYLFVNKGLLIIKIKRLLYSNIYREMVKSMMENAIEKKEGFFNK